MKPLPVYPLYDITPVRAGGSFVYTADDERYLDFYGGHAVISIGHGHPHYRARIAEQLDRIGFYSNSVRNPLQEELARKLGEVAGTRDAYDLFLCSSGAEANENALKMASFARPGTDTVLVLDGSFHGRTSAAVALTDNPKIQAGINRGVRAARFSGSDTAGIVARIERGDLTAVLLEVVQGVGGLSVLPDTTLQAIERACAKTGTPLIADEVQSGYGRTGKFFAYQHSGITPDLVSVAKGMGNGFPVGGVLVRNGRFEVRHGMLGTTYGGNHLACAAGLGVLEVLERERLVEGVAAKSARLRGVLERLPHLRRVKGLGLMIGAEFEFPVAALRKHLAYEQRLMTGSSQDPHVLRLLPPLTITESEMDLFAEKICAGVDAFLAAHPEVLPAHA